jgi:hypothetical protein
MADKRDMDRDLNQDEPVTGAGEEQIRGVGDDADEFEDTDDLDDEEEEEGSTF